MADAAPEESVKGRQEGGRAGWNPSCLDKLYHLPVERLIKGLKWDWPAVAIAGTPGGMPPQQRRQVRRDMRRLGRY
jgi:hypothetical protein